jgi:DNA-binding CsgD family transcriptional regulator
VFALPHHISKYNFRVRVFLTFSPEFSGMFKLLDNDLSNYHFTRRELRIIHLTRAGLSSKLIAEMLSVSPRKLAELIAGIQQKIDQHHTQMVIGMARSVGFL